MNITLLDINQSFFSVWFYIAHLIGIESAAEKKENSGSADYRFITTLFSVAIFSPSSLDDR